MAVSITTMDLQVVSFKNNVPGILKERGITRYALSKKLTEDATKFGLGEDITAHSLVYQSFGKEDEDLAYKNLITLIRIADAINALSSDEFDKVNILDLYTFSL